VLCRMFSQRGVAAADMTTLEAHAQVNPGHTELQALFATPRMGFHIPDESEMGANWHNRSLRPDEAVRTMLSRNA
jgi:hypothetical protein